MTMANRHEIRLNHFSSVITQAVASEMSRKMSKDGAEETASDSEQPEAAESTSEKLVDQRRGN